MSQTPTQLAPTGDQARVARLDVIDVRFPTSRDLDGSDAMNPDPDYSAAYVILTTDDPALPTGHGLTFTIGRGTEVVVAAVEALRPLVVGRSVGEMRTGMGAFWRDLVGDSQLRWVGPEKGVFHLAVAAIVNAAWDLLAKLAGKPLWQLLADLPSEAIVEAIDFRYIDDAITPDEVMATLARNRPTRAEREAELLREGYPAYTTSVGWLGYSDEKIDRLCREALDAGWTRFKMKVGADVDDDIRRARLIRERIGPDHMLAVDANQRWGVDEAIAWVSRLSEFRPAWVEEPTSPDDILGHARIARAIAPVPVATGEHVHNRVMFKQLFQAEAIGVCQIDACRVGGVNENLAILFMAAKFGVPVCPHAGGVGLCELVQHLSIFDYLCVSASLEGRMIEYVDHLHEHFTDPVTVIQGRYQVPRRPGYSSEMHADSLRRYAFPEGAEWSASPVIGAEAEEVAVGDVQPAPR
ncbi:enolase C-terminal domain-like protein [soil metagenome]